MLLEEYKYVAKEKIISTFIVDNTEISPDDSDKESSDEENSNDENSDEENEYTFFQTNI